MGDKLNRPLEDLIKADSKKKKPQGAKNTGSKGAARPGGNGGKGAALRSGGVGARTFKSKSGGAVPRAGPQKSSLKASRPQGPRAHQQQQRQQQGQQGQGRVTSTPRKTLLRQSDNLQVKVVNNRATSRTSLSHSNNNNNNNNHNRSAPRAAQPQRERESGVTLHSLIEQHGQIEGHRKWDEVQAVLKGSAPPRVTVRHDPEPSRVAVYEKSEAAPVVSMSTSTSSARTVSTGSSGTTLSSLFGSLSKGY